MATPGAPGTPVILAGAAPVSACESSYTGDLGVGDNTGQLGGQGHQESFIALIEATPLRLLHHQHTQQPRWWIMGTPKNA